MFWDSAAGIMVTALIRSLLIPDMEQSEPMGKLEFIPAVIDFWGGILFLLDHIIPHLHMNVKKAEEPKCRLMKTIMIVFCRKITYRSIRKAVRVEVRAAVV